MMAGRGRTHGGTAIDCRPWGRLVSRPRDTTSNRSRISSGIAAVKGGPITSLSRSRYFV